MSDAVIKELRDMGFTVLTRAQWGTRHEGIYQTRRRTRTFVGPADHFFAHITVTRPSSSFAADVRVIEDIGVDRFGTGCSYNWMVDADTGAIAQGQPLDAAGAHTLNDKGVPGFPSNLNYWGHAIAWIGMPTTPISGRAIEAYAAIIAAEKKHGAAKDDARLYPHSKFAWKDCPCDQVRDQIPHIEHRADVLLANHRERDWFTMATKEDLRQIVREELDRALKINAPWDPKKGRVSLNRALRAIWQQAHRDNQGGGESPRG